MSIDKSLRRKGRLVRTRNVLKRGERLQVLGGQDRWTEEDSPVGLPKTRIVKTVVGKKKKKPKKEDDDKK
ncbi:MAG: small basic protein [Planctomycetota bacterium]